MFGWRIAALDDSGVVVATRLGAHLVIAFEEILTVERLRSQRGFWLHTRSEMKPTRVRCRRRRAWEIEDGLRVEGVRVVDCWGAVIAPTLLDFMDETRARAGSSATIV